MSILWIALAVLGGVTLVVALSFQRQLAQSMDELDQGLKGLSKSIAQEQVRIEQMLEVTTTSVEDMHRAISDVSFDILEAIPRTREAGKRMRNVHDTYAGNLYGGVRVLSKGLGVLRERSKRRGTAIESSSNTPKIKTIEGRYEPLGSLEKGEEHAIDSKRVGPSKKPDDSD